MSVKINDATLNRPDGKRLIDAPAVLVDINHYRAQLKDEKAWGKNDRNGVTVFKTPGLTMVLSAFHKDAEIKDLQLDGLIVLQVMEGQINVSTETEEQKLTVNQILVLHPEAQHTLTALEDTIVLLSALKESGQPTV